MEDVIYAVYGKSGYGREVMPLVSHQYANQSAKTIFIDDSNDLAMVNGHEVWSFEKLLSHPASKKQIVIAIGDSAIRERLVSKCNAANIAFMNVTASNHIRLENVLIGDGAIFNHFTMLTSNVKIGAHFHCNIYSYIAHDCVIGDYVTFAPGVKCNGNVHIGDHAYIGTGAIIKQGTPEKPLRIGKGAVVGMGAVVTKDVADGVIVVGNPAKPFG